MKAAQISGYGNETVMQTVVDSDKPSIDDDQVLVEVHAAAANPFDYKVRDGDLSSMINLEFPAVLGSDLAGIVSRVGSAVKNVQAGDEVYGMANAVSGHGSYAEFAPVKASSLAIMPADIDFETAAALPLAAVSALQALEDHAHLQAGQKLLIHGGSGGIGALAIQIAKAMGAYVATTASKDNLDYVKQLGADEVIDYKAENFADVMHDYDVVFDTVGGDTNKQSYSVLKPGGILVSMTTEADEALAKQYDITYIHEFTQTTTERLDKITRLVDAGQLTVNIDKMFSLDEAAQALEYLKTAHPRGKVVIKIK